MLANRGEDPSNSLVVGQDSKPIEGYYNGKMLANLSQ